jgi:two-component system chemotaxis response regulator CheY
VATPAIPAANRQAPTVLVVERDALMRELVCEWLAGAGFAVSTWDGISRAPLVPPAVIVADVDRPRRSDATRLRAVQAVFPHTPIIAISGYFRPGLCGAGTTATALGVRQTIAKPFGRDQLIASVRELAGPAKT